MDDPSIYQEYLVPIFSELFQEDGLTVLGKGLGIDILFSKFVQLYSRKESRKLVFCLNLNGKEQAIVELMTSLGIPPNELPKIINNEINSNERGEMYQEGGCFFITSRILIVDLLDNRVDSSKIAGFLLYQANRISETSIESFIIRVYRERNRLGFIKAFSDEPENMSGGFGKIERILKNLFLTKLYLWPRFRLEIAKFLESRTQPEVIEMILPLTGLMKATQNAILVAMNSCLNELKKSCPMIDTTQFTLENGIFYSFDSQLKNQLDPEWHKIPLRTKQIINDVSIIRKLLDYLVRYDSFSFYYLLLNIRSSSSDQHPSLWLLTEAANKVFQYAKERVYRIIPPNAVNKLSFTTQNRIKTTQNFLRDIGLVIKSEDQFEPVLEYPPKWNALFDALKEIRINYQKAKLKNQKLNSSFLSFEGRVLLIARDELALSQLKDIIIHGPDYAMDQRFRWFISKQCADIRRKISNKAKIALKSNKDTLSSTSEAINEIDLSDKTINDLLSSNSTTLASNSGYFDLGISENDFKSLPSESQLLLVQEKVLYNSQPSQSKQQKRTLEVAKQSKRNLDEEDSNDFFGDFRSKKTRLIETDIQDEDVMLEGSFLDSDIQLTMVTQSQIKDQLTLLNDLKPKYIVLYDSDVQIIRTVEIYQSKLPEPISLYLLQYEESIEEHRYVGSLAREKKAFESLISTKEHMVISLPDHPFDLQREKAEDQLMASTDSRALNSMNKSLKQIQGRKIVVDVREFRSTLPSILHCAQFHLLPRTISVGDYVLTPEICVERKGISDLFQSFASGRLYNQVESMSKYYKFPCLLIEFSPDKPFGFTPSSEISSDIQMSAIFSKIVLLTQSFPLLRIFWSKSASHTVDIFKSIISNHDEVDVEKAINAGSGLFSEDGLNGLDGLEGDQEIQATTQEILMSLPGINVHNYRQVCHQVENLAQLSKLSEQELVPLIGPGNAKKLASFFRQQVL